MPKVSVIVPVYGVEKYIERCARSLFEQTLDDIEYIFVDDCSPDNSIKILERIIEEYRLRFAEKRCSTKIEKMPTNSGQAAVRRHGIQFATGDYIAHCDSDDWVDIHMYEDMYNKAVEVNADVVVCDFKRTDANQYNKVEKGAHTTIINKFITNSLFQRDHWSLCNKIFKRKFYYKVIYPQGALGEDMVMTIQLLSQCRRMVYVPQTYYYYYVNPTSITKKVSVENCYRNFCALRDNTDLMARFIEHDIKLSNRLKKSTILYLRLVNSFSLLKIRHLPQYHRLWKENFVRMPLSFFLNYRIPLYNKMLYCLSLFPFYPLEQDRAYN